MTRKLLVLSRRFPDNFLSSLAQLGEIRIVPEYEGESTFEGASVYVTTAVDPVTAEFISNLPDSVKYIASAGGGFG